MKVNLPFFYFYDILTLVMLMKIIDILNKYQKADMFSLTGGYYKMYITKEEYEKALVNAKELIKKHLKEIYDKKAPFVANIPSFNDFFNEIEMECREYSEIYKPRTCMDIIIHLDTFTKYGEMFRNFYQDISFHIDRENDMNSFKFNNGKDPVKVVPKELINSLIKYEVSFFNAVTESGSLMINYYFKLNDETKNYLLKYEEDFDLDELQDLTLYQNNKIKFYSCTHEKYNSFEEFY